MISSIFSTPGKIKLDQISYQFKSNFLSVLHRAAFDPPGFFQDDVCQDSRIRDLGVFSQWHQRLSQKVLSAWGRCWTLWCEAGHITAQFPDACGKIPSRREPNLNLTASVHFRLTSATHLNVAFGRGTRTPNLIERYSTFIQKKSLCRKISYWQKKKICYLNYDLI